MHAQNKASVTLSLHLYFMVLHMLILLHLLCCILISTFFDSSIPTINVKNVFTLVSLSLILATVNVYVHKRAM